MENGIAVFGAFGKARIKGTVLFEAAKGNSKNDSKSKAIIQLSGLPALSKFKLWIGTTTIHTGETNVLGLVDWTSVPLNAHASQFIGQGLQLFVNGRMLESAVIGIANPSSEIPLF